MYPSGKTSNDLNQALERLSECQNFIGRFNISDSQNYEADMDVLKSILELCSAIIQRSLQGLQATWYMRNKNTA